MFANVLLVVLLGGCDPLNAIPDRIRDEDLRGTLGSETEARAALEKKFSQPIVFWTNSGGLEGSSRVRPSKRQSEPVVKIDFKRQLVGDKELQLIGKFRQLDELELVGDFTNDGLRYLSGLSGLRKLSLYSPMISDAGVSQFEGKALTELVLANTFITDKSVQHIATFAKLRTLNLSNCAAVTDKGIRDLLKLKNLQALWIPGTAVTDSGLEGVAQMKQLKVLGLASPSITEKGVKKLTALRELQTLYVDGVVISPSVVRELENALPETHLLGIPRTRQ